MLRAASRGMVECREGHGILSLAGALTGFASTAAYGSVVAEHVSDSVWDENGAGPIFSPSGPNAGLCGAAEGFPIADHSLTQSVIPIRSMPCPIAPTNTSSWPTATARIYFFLGKTVGKLTSKNRVPSSAAIRLPTSVLATKIPLLAGLAIASYMTDITKIFGSKTAFLEDEKRFSADISGNARLRLDTRRR